MACQRFTVNVTSLCLFPREIDVGIFMVLPFCRRKLVRDFGGKDGTKSPMIVSNPSAFNKFGMPLSTII